MGLFHKKNTDISNESAMTAVENNNVNQDAVVRQMAKYQKKQVRSIMDEDLKMTQDIKEIHKEFDNIL